MNMCVFVCVYVGGWGVIMGDKQPPWFRESYKLDNFLSTSFVYSNKRLEHSLTVWCCFQI